MQDIQIGTKLEDSKITCSICLERIPNGKDRTPCKCQFIKVHDKCLSSGHKCSLCGEIYQRTSFFKNILSYFLLALYTVAMLSALPLAVGGILYVIISNMKIVISSYPVYPDLMISTTNSAVNNSMFTFNCRLSEEYLFTNVQNLIDNCFDSRQRSDGNCNGTIVSIMVKDVIISIEDVKHSIDYSYEEYRKKYNTDYTVLNMIQYCNMGWNWNPTGTTQKLYTNYDIIVSSVLTIILTLFVILISGKVLLS